MPSPQHNARMDAVMGEEHALHATVADALCTGLLAALAPHERDALSRHARLQTFAPGTALFQEGDESADAMLLLSGLVKLCRHSSQGKECVLHLVHTETLSDIPIGHKIALQDLAEGDTVIKYGTDIGKVVQPIKRGEHLHVHNVKTKRW